MTKFTTAAVAAAFIGSLALAAGSAYAAPVNQSAAFSHADAATTWTGMKKHKKMKMKKGKMMGGGSTMGAKKGL